MRKLLNFLCIGLILIVLTGCGKKDIKDEELSKGKSEIRFLENRCNIILDKFYLDEYLLESNQPDWNLIDEDYNVLNNSKDVILIDFTSLNILSDNINKLEEFFRNLKDFEKNKDLNGFMFEICNIYNLTSTSILDSISEDEPLKLEKKAKSDLIYIKYYFKLKNKDEILKQIDIFEQDVSNLNSSKEYLENNSYKINKIFLNTQRLKTFILEENYDSGEEALNTLLEFF